MLIITAFLIYRSSLYASIKVLLCLFLVYWLTRQQKIYNFEVKSLSFQNQKWVLEMSHEQLIYDELVILIHNPYFQLLQLTHGKGKKLLILFHDQVSKHHRRLLHLQASNRFDQ